MTLGFVVPTPSVEPSLRAVTVRDVVEFAARALRVTPAALVGGSRYATLVRARHAAMFVARKLLALAVVACGGMVEPPPPAACVTDDGPHACAAGVYVFEALDGGGTRSSGCEVLGECTPGARCAVAGDVGARYGTCR